MTKEDSPGTAPAFDPHREQEPIGLRLTPAQRLRWLEETMETLRRWQGRARSARGERDRREEG